MSFTFDRLIIAFLIILLCMQQCSSCRVINGLKGELEQCREDKPTVNAVQVTAIDTQYIRHTDTLTQTITKPYAVYRPSKTQVDSFIAFEPLPFDTAAFLQTYFGEAYYRDTTETQYGSIIIEDTLHQNRIAGRRVLTDFTIPTTTITQEKSVEAPKRNQVYFTLTATGSQNLPLEYLGAGFLLKTKTDAAWHLNSLLDAKGGVHVQFGRSWKISFKH